MPDLKAFLFRAWKTKDCYEFKGIPKYLILGNDIVEKYPDVANLAKNIQGFDLEMAENGFSTGIRSVRDWIRCIDNFTWNPKFSNISDFNMHSERFCREFNLRTNSKKAESNLERWANNKPKGILIDNMELFYEQFEK